jgi:hypothetical protein
MTGMMLVAHFGVSWDRQDQIRNALEVRVHVPLRGIGIPSLDGLKDESESNDQ